MSSAYHPQTNGQTEIVNKCLETYLRCSVTDKQNKWLQWLHLVEWCYNSTSHTSAKMTPFQALYGYQPPTWKELATNQTKVAPVKDLLDESQKVVQILKENLVIARNRMKQQAGQHRTEREFEVGEWVLVRLQPYKQLSIKQQGLGWKNPDGLVLCGDDEEAKRLMEELHNEFCGRHHLVQLNCLHFVLSYDIVLSHII
jgi:hypothetical protein